MTVPNVFDADQLMQWAHEQLSLASEDVDTMLGRVGRNQQPTLLVDLWDSGLLTEEVLATNILGVWSAAEYPARTLDPDTWVELFGSVRHLLPDLPDTPVRLYRGVKSADSARGMSWTPLVDLALWFANRYADLFATGEVWTTVARPEAVLARIDGDRHGGRGGEDEYILDPGLLGGVERLR